jgi:hypothetical protein
MSDIIDILAVVVALAVGISAAVLSYKNIEASTRPYITALLQKAISFDDRAACYFTIKNFGASSGYIEQIDTDIKVYSTLLLDDAFDISSIKGVALAPGQSLSFYIALDDVDKWISVEIYYRTGRKKYIEKTKIHLASYIAASELDITSAIYDGMEHIGNAIYQSEAGRHLP